ncbi:MAG: CDP-alcohol phosphatidyltransferase family protein, partial [Deltaproteobacteria bacterium]|nr:CDP-alcohol phosphatidyltransferase family protein [Deltaproteobacteria bacterium]
MKNWRYIVPNFFTAINFLMGTASILMSYEGELYWATWLVLWCVLLDKADGTAARLLDASSDFGSELDSMADMVAFGLAPAFLVYSYGRHAWGLAPFEAHWVLLVVGCGIYAVCNAMRLAKYNVAEHLPGERYFKGVPTTVSGAIIGSAILVADQYSLPLELVRFFPIVLIVIALGMISNLPVPKVLPRKNLAFNLFQIINIVGVYILGICRLLPEYILGLCLLYL